MDKKDLKSLTTCFEYADLITTGINLITLEKDINSTKYYISNLNRYNLVSAKMFIKFKFTTYNISYAYISFDYSYQSTLYSLHILLSYLVLLKNQTCAKTTIKHIGFSLLKTFFLK